MCICKSSNSSAEIVGKQLPQLLFRRANQGKIRDERMLSPLQIPRAMHPMTRWSLGHLPAGMQEQARAQIAGQPAVDLGSLPALAPKEKRSKYGNTPTVVDGIRFDSRSEARYYDVLKNKWHMDEILWFTRQIPFALPGGITYRADFLVALKGGGIDVVDVKGYMSEVSRIKIKQVEEIYGITVRLWPERKSA